MHHRAERCISIDNVLLSTCSLVVSLVQFWCNFDHCDERNRAFDTYIFYFKPKIWLTNGHCIGGWESYKRWWIAHLIWTNRKTQDEFFPCTTNYWITIQNFSFHFQFPTAWMSDENWTSSSKIRCSNLWKSRVHIFRVHN